MRVILISGEPAFRLGFRVVIESAGDLALVAEAADARAGFRAVDDEAPEVVVMDVALPGMNGVAATREVKRRLPTARVLLLGSWPRERDVLDGFAAGADGFALKTEPVAALIDAIRTVGQGNRYLTPDVRGISDAAPRAGDGTQPGRPPNGRAPHRGGARPSDTAADVLDALSAREREVLDLVIRGWRNRDMARELCVSIKTIDTHRTRINRKLRCRSAAELIRFAADNGLLRGEALAARATGEPRTIVIFVDDSPNTRAALARAATSEGYEESHAATVTSAIAALGEGEAAHLWVVDPPATRALVGAGVFEPRSSVHAVASLPDPGSGDRFIAALDRAMAEGSPSGWHSA